MRPPEAWDTRGLCCAFEGLSLCVGFEKEKKKHPVISETKTSPSPGPSWGLFSQGAGRGCVCYSSRRGDGAGGTGEPPELEPGHRRECTPKHGHRACTRPCAQADTQARCTLAHTHTHVYTRTHTCTRAHTHTHAHTTRTASSEFRNCVGSPVPQKPQAELRSQTGRPHPRDRPCSSNETPPQVAFSGPPDLPGSAKCLIPWRLPEAPSPRAETAALWPHKNQHTKRKGDIWALWENTASKDFFPPFKHQAALGILSEPRPLPALGCGLARSSGSRPATPSSRGQHCHLPFCSPSLGGRPGGLRPPPLRPAAHTHPPSVAPCLGSRPSPACRPQPLQGAPSCHLHPEPRDPGPVLPTAGCRGWSQPAPGGPHTYLPPLPPSIRAPPLPGSPQHPCRHPVRPPSPASPLTSFGPQPLT